MQLKFIGNACCIYNSKGKRLLADPWLIDGAFDGSWYHYPPLKTKPVDVASVDYLYISHLHPDHFDPETLNYFPREIPILVLDHEPNFLKKMLNRLGFNHVLSIKDGDTQQVGPFEITMYAPFAKHVFHNSEIGNLIDSAVVIRSGDFSIFNSNDNTPSLESAKSLRNKHGKFSIAQINYNAAGPFPSCFDNLSIEEKKSAHQRILDRNLKHMLDLGKILEAKFIMPFAGSYVIAGKEWAKNKFLGTTTWDKAAKYLVDNNSKSKPLVLNEGLSFDLSTGCVDGNYIPIDEIAMEKYICETLSRILYPYEQNPLQSESEILEYFKESLPKARANLLTMQERYNYFPDINVYISLPNGKFLFNLNSKESLFVQEQENLIQPYLKCRLDYRLLKQILERKAHWNNAEIGCHINFIRTPDNYLPDLHTMLSFLHLPAPESSSTDFALRQ